MDPAKPSWHLKTSSSSGNSTNSHRLKSTNSAPNSLCQVYSDFKELSEKVYNAETLKDEVDSLLLLFDLISPYLGNTGHRKPGQHYQLEDLFTCPNFSEHSNNSSSSNKGGGFRGESKTSQYPQQTERNLELQSFLNYVFNRRFGWSEMGKSYLRSTGMMDNVCMAQNSLWKRNLNELLDEIRLGLQKQDVSNTLLNSLKNTMLQAAEKPVVRNQTLIHTLEWLKKKVLITPIFELCFPLVKEIFVIGLTDVWSAIRSATASRLVQILQHLSLQEYQQFFEELLNVCKDEQSSWQSKEGAIIGVHVMIKAFVWVKREGNYGLSLGRQFLPKIPAFITNGLDDIAHALMRHPQLTIREYTVKCFATLTMRCHFSERLTSFESILQKLASLLDIDVGTRRKDSLQLTENRTKFTLKKGEQNAYIAESLLGVALAHIKVTHPSILLPNWPLHFSIFSPYLSHPASTVRQAASMIFKVMIAGNPNNVYMTKVLLQSLLIGWNTNKTLLSASITNSREVFSSNEQDLRQSEKGLSVDQTNSSQCWEWKEGRLLAYELIMNYLLKNHWFYTFGYPMNSRMNSPSGKNQYPTRSSSQCETRETSLKTFNSNPNLSNSGSRAEDLQLSENLAFPLVYMPTLEETVEAFCSYNDPYPPFNIPNLPEFLENQGVSSILEKCMSINVTNERYSKKDTKTSSMQKNQLGMSILKQHGFEFTSWAVKFNLLSMGDILEIILDQTLECMSDSQWELQRIGNQLFQPLLEVIRWYDMNIMVRMWNSKINLLPSIYSFGACFALRDWSYHCRKLLPLLRNDGEEYLANALTQNYSQKNTKVLQNLIKTLNIGDLSVWIFILKQQLEKNNFDKLSVLIIEILMSVNSLYCNHSSIMGVENDSLRQQLAGSAPLINDIIIQIFFRAHQDVSFYDLFENVGFHTELKLEQTTHPFLQFSFSNQFKSNSSSSDALLLARQAENYLLNHTQCIFFDYVNATLKSNQASFLRLLPILIFYVDYRLSDDLFVKDLMDSIRFIISTTVEASIMRDNLSYICKALCYLIEIHNSDFSELPLTLTSCNFDDHFSLVSLMLYGHIVKEPFVIKHTPIIYNSSEKNILSEVFTNCIRNISNIIKKCKFSPKPNATKLPWRQDLTMLSNQIPLPESLDDSESDTGDEVETAIEVVQPKNLKESLALSASGNSGNKSPGSGHDSLNGSRTTKHGDIAAKYDSDSSDWDSDSDDGNLDLADQLLHAETVLFRLKNLLGESWWEVVCKNLSKEKLELAETSINKAMKKQKSESKNVKKSKVTFEDEFVKGKSKHLRSKKRLNRCHSSMN